MQRRAARIGLDQPVHLIVDELKSAILGLKNGSTRQVLDR